MLWQFVRPTNGWRLSANPIEILTYKVCASSVCPCRPTSAANHQPLDENSHDPPHGISVIPHWTIDPWKWQTQGKPKSWKHETGNTSEPSDLGGPKEPREWTHSEPKEPNDPRELPKEPSHTERVVIIRRKEKRRKRKLLITTAWAKDSKKENRICLRRGAAQWVAHVSDFPFFHDFSTTTNSTNIWNSDFRFSILGNTFGKTQTGFEISKKNKRCSGEALIKTNGFDNF